MHDSTVQVKMRALVSFAAVQKKSTAILCQCIYTFQDLLFTQVFSCQKPMHYSTVHGRMHAFMFCAAVEAKSSLVPVP